MALDREAILNALRARLEESVPGMRQVSRRIRGWDTANYPALFIDTESESVDGFGKWTIRIRVALFINIPPNDESPERLLRAAIDGVCDALAARPGEMPTFANGPTTLGGKCSEASPTGDFDMDQGIDGIGQAVIPVEIIAYEKD